MLYQKGFRFVESGPLSVDLPPCRKAYFLIPFIEVETTENTEFFHGGYGAELPK
ncbi:MAG: hypothetical protein IPG08_12635 [Sphingobacteriaceae bacterium]|nr:hypothetical protein [Sphingobacteriaceae bacterium]